MKILQIKSKILENIPEAKNKRGLKKLSAYLKYILNLDADPNKIAYSFAIGVFVSLTPVYGTHTICMLILIPLLRLHFISAIIGSAFNLPFIAIFIYPIQFKLGQLIMGKQIIYDQAIKLPKSIGDFFNLIFSEYTLYNLLLPFLVGSLIFSLVVALISYLILKILLKRIKKINKKIEVKET